MSKVKFFGFEGKQIKKKKCKGCGTDISTRMSKKGYCMACAMKKKI